MITAPPRPTFLRRFALAVALIATAVTATAQQSRQRYYIKSRVLEPTEHTKLLQAVAAVAVDADPQTGVVQDIYYPQFGFSAVGTVLRPDQVSLMDSARYEVLEDVPLMPAGPPAGPAWPLNQFSVEVPPPGCDLEDPVVYVVDSGITPGHSDFIHPSGQQVLSFLPGLSYGYDLSGPTPVPLPPYVDPHDHGTRVTGCLGGLTSGLLGPLGGRVRVKSVSVYDFPSPPGFPLATYVSKAINGVLGAATDHIARRSEPYLRHRASILIFAHTTTPVAGRFADLDRAVEVAAQEGIHVVLSAGNNAVPAVQVSPAGAAWGYVQGSLPTRFFFGAAPPGALYYRAANEFLVTGAFGKGGNGGLQLWAGSNLNIPGANAVDLFAPGVTVPCPSAAGPGIFALGSGTSYSAGFTAAVTTWVAFLCPWATPAQVRTSLLNATTAAFGFPKLETPAVLPDGLRYREWIEAYYPAAVGLATERDPTGDPDDDGLPNFVEYYGGLDPRRPDAEFSSKVSLAVTTTEAALEVTLPRACYLPGTPEVEWDLQTSEDLLTWTPLATTGFSAVMPPEVTGDGRKWRAKAAGIPPPGMQCYRLRFFANAPLL